MDNGRFAFTSISTLQRALLLFFAAFDWQSADIVRGAIRKDNREADEARARGQS